MKKTLKALVITLLFFAESAEAKLLDVSAFTLGNGLQVVVVPNHKAPVVQQMLWYKVGSIDEPSGKGGIAHLLEHLMFRGTHKVPGSKYNDIVSNNGGESNAFTSHDFTAYYIFTDISRLEVAMALEADRMRNLDISEEAFETERKIVFQERKQRISNNPAARFSEKLNKVFWQNAPYARPVTGTEEEILELTRKNAVDFYEKYYTPQNAILVLTGDIDVETAKTLSEKHFGSIKRGPKVERKSLTRQDDETETSYFLQTSMPEIKTSRVIRKYAAPSILDNPKQAYALMIFAKYLGGGGISYLYKNFVLPGNMTDVSASYDGLARLGGVFTIAAIPEPFSSAYKTNDMLQEGIQSAVINFNEEVLEKTKKQMLSGLVYIRDNPRDAAMLVGQMMVLGMRLEDIENYEANIKAVTLADVQEAVASLLYNNVSATGFLQKAPKIKQISEDKTRGN